MLFRSLDPQVRPYLDPEDGAFEVPLTWTDADTGLPCKGKLDWLIPSTKTIVDLKTCRDASTRRFCGDIGRYNYHAQLAHYAAGVHAALGWRPERLVLIATEKIPPYDVGVFTIGAELRDVGAEIVRDLLRRVRDCRDAQSWPGAHPDPVYIERETKDVPGWLFGGDDDTIEFDSEE